MLEQTKNTCTLPGFDRSLWERTEISDNDWMGAPRNYDREGVDPNWVTPGEPAEAGCPGAWYRTEFVGSLMRYYRPGDGNGGRVENLDLRDCTDSLVREAVRALEFYENAAMSKHYEDERARRERE